MIKYNSKYAKIRLAIWAATFVVGVAVGYCVRPAALAEEKPRDLIYVMKKSKEDKPLEQIPMAEAGIGESASMDGCQTNVNVEAEINEHFLGEFELTAYCSCSKCCGKWADCRPVDENGEPIVYGASGEVLVSGFSIAVDPSVIPYGAKVCIDGKIYIAHDCGGAIKGNRIDVYFDNHDEALQFGRQNKSVYLIGNFAE